MFTKKVIQIISSAGLIGTAVLLVTTCGNGKPQDEVVRYNQPRLVLQNAGFELGQTGWKPIAINLAGVRVIVDSAEAIEGTRSLRIDLSQAQSFPEAEFQLASEWLNLPGGGEFEFSAYVKADAPDRRVALRMLNGVTKKLQRNNRRIRRRVAEEHTVGTAWTQLSFGGELQPAEQDAYRLAIELEAPGIYWIDRVEFLHNGRSIISTPEIEAALQVADHNRRLHSTSQGAALAFALVNRSARRGDFELMIRHRNPVQDAVVEKRHRVSVLPLSTSQQLLHVDLNHAGIHRLDWQLRDARGVQIDQGWLTLAAVNTALPVAPDSSAVWGMHFSALNLDLTLPVLQAFGIKHLRNVVNLHWYLVEPQQDRWQGPDEMLHYLSAQGFQMLGLLGFPPRWASAPGGNTNLLNKMPRAMDEFRAYVHRTVDKYGDKIPAWEVWNEPNLERYFEGTAEQYAKLLSAAVDEILATRPQAEIAGLSLAWSDENLNDYAREVLRQSASPPEAISFHPYEKESPEIAGMTGKIAALQSLVAAEKQFTPSLWVTEAGYRARDSINQAIPYFTVPRPRTVTAMTQAEYLVRHAVLAKAAGVKYYFCYSLDSERHKRGPDIHGLLDYDWAASVKPALLAYGTLAQLFGAALFEQRLDLGDSNKYALRFRRGDGRSVTVVWQITGQGQIDLPKELKGAEIYDMFGNRTPMTATQIRLSSRPLYLIN